MKNISIYSFLLLTLLLLTSTRQSQAQQQRIRGPRLGVDVSGLAWHYAEPGQLSVAVSMDMEVMPAIYAAVEAGRLRVNREQQIFRYQAQGYYAKIGADYNFMQQKLSGATRYDMIYGGLRFGAASFSHHADRVNIENGYWGTYPGESLSEYTMQAYWTELVAGIRVEALKNIFLGWSIRGQLMLSNDKDPRMNSWMIPGFGKNTGSTSLSFTYSIAYRIPLYRVPAGKRE